MKLKIRPLKEYSIPELKKELKDNFTLTKVFLILFIFIIVSFAVSQPFFESLTGLRIFQTPLDQPVMLSMLSLIFTVVVYYQVINNRVMQLILIKANDLKT